MNHDKPQRTQNNSELILLNQRILPYLRNLGYSHIESNVTVYLGNRLVEVDAVAYLDADKKEPYVVIELKNSIRSEPSLLDPSVQQAFTAASALGKLVRYLLITNGEKYYWFERIPENQSLVPLKYPPENQSKISQGSLFDEFFISVTDPDQYNQLLQPIIDILRKEGLSFGIRMAIELNRVIIAKIFDEQQNANKKEKEYQFNSSGDDPYVVSLRIKSLYQKAVSISSRDKYIDEGIWSLSPQALLSVVKLLEPYAISKISKEVIGRTFWIMFPALLKREEGAYTTPLPLATLIAQLAQPKLEELILDPACGTGLLLLESVRFIQNQLITLYDSSELPIGYNDKNLLFNSFTGLELNSEVAELAATNFAINGLPYTNIINVNSLNKQSRDRYGIQPNSYDVLVSNPPFGFLLDGNETYLRDYRFTLGNSKVSIEVLFLELSLNLLKWGGRLVILVPDSFLSSKNLTYARTWLLGHTTNRAIISLPPETFAIAGHKGKASILLLEKRHPVSDQEPVLVVDIKNIGYDRFGKPTRENDLPQLIDTVKRFQETGEVHRQLEQGSMRIWTIPVSRLNPERLDIAQLDPAGNQLINALSYGRYPTVRIEEIAEIISGRNFKTYVEQGPDTAILIQAGAVRDLEINTTSLQYISYDEYQKSGRVKLQPGDVLVTTTGQYLGRAAAVETLSEAAVASGAVTILRPRNDLDPVFLAAVVTSPIGKEQIYQRQASATAQPYIRRADLGHIVIPLPPLNVQKELAYKITSMLADARALQKRATEIEADAKGLVISELLGTAQDE